MWFEVIGISGGLGLEGREMEEINKLWLEVHRQEKREFDV